MVEELLHLGCSGISHCIYILYKSVLEGNSSNHPLFKFIGQVIMELLHNFWSG
jgi:hypothetical protein